MDTPCHVQPTIRQGYIRLRPSPEDQPRPSYFGVDDLQPLPRFLQNHIVSSLNPFLRYIYLVNLISSADEQVLDWLIEQSRPLSEEEVEEMDRWSPRSRQRLRRCDFEVYITREKAKSERGRTLRKRLVAESVKHHILSPSDIRNALESLSDALHTSDASYLEDELDRYLLFIKSDFLISQTDMDYPNWYCSTQQQCQWWRAVRDGSRELPGEKVDYSTMRLRDRCNGRIQRRCDCSGMHPRCPRPTDQGPQWLCPCGGPCKRNKRCNQGWSRKSDEYRHAGFGIPCISNTIHKGDAMFEALEGVTSEELCRHLRSCNRGGPRTQDPCCIAALSSTDRFSGDWKTE